MKLKNFKCILLSVVTGCVVSACCSCKDSFSRVEPLNSSVWESSDWISAANAPIIEGKIKNGSRAADGANWFLSTVKNEKKVVSAKWMTTALGVFDIYVNGKCIGNEILKPGFTDAKKTKISFTYDITSLINRGEGEENIFSAQVTPGWWGDKIVTPDWNEGMIGKKCAFRAVLQLVYSDGTTELFGTNTENWKAGIAGPILHAAIFDGEEYDARIKQGYDTPELLSTPEINSEFQGEIVPSVGAEVYLRKDLALSPVKIYTWEGIENSSEECYGKVIIKKEFKQGEPIVVNKGENLIVDFGQNCAGVPCFDFKADAGVKLTCYPAELLNDSLGSKKRGMDGPEGSVHRRNLRIPDNSLYLEYTFADTEGNAEFYPQNTFFGYRFVSIVTTDKVIINKITSIPVSSISSELEIGKITTGNDLINKLISNTYWGQLSNYLSVPTDCPQRNERLGWTADTQVFTETGSFFANTRAFFHKWMRDMLDSQAELGGFPGVAPVAQYGGSYMRVGWADAGIIVPWTIWKQYGDVDLVNECWDGMVKYINRVNEIKYDHSTSVAENQNYQWADWLSYEPLESCSGKAFDEHGLKPEALNYWNFLSASYWAIDAAMMRDMAVATGRDSKVFEQMIADAKAFLRETFMDENGEFKTPILNTMQTPALFALKNNLVEGENKAKMLARLRQNFEDHGNCLQSGFLGTSIIMDVLTENGMSDMAYKLLYQRKNPSWLYSIDNGATTIWERWNSYTIENGMGPSGMNSFNHYAYGAVCAWIWKTVAGIASDVSCPGFKHIIMKPIPDKGLGFINAEYNSASGLIKSSWKYEGDKWIWNFTIPEGATASVTLPGETETTEYQAGTYTIER